MHLNSVKYNSKDLPTLNKYKGQWLVFRHSILLLWDGTTSSTPQGKMSNNSLGVGPRERQDTQPQQLLCQECSRTTTGKILCLFSWTVRSTTHFTAGFKMNTVKQSHHMAAQQWRIISKDNLTLYPKWLWPYGLQDAEKCVHVCGCVYHGRPSGRQVTV